MKNILIIMISMILFPFLGSSQIIENIDEVTPFHEELAAIRKGEQWAFINTNGDIVIDYRNDLVKTKTKKDVVTYPHFEDGKCLIKQKINGVDHYGYIDHSGKTVIKPEYLNATNFDHGYAIVLKVSKEELGRNDLLDKKVVSYSYNEIVIDHSGNQKIFLTGPIHLVYKKERLRKPPVILSYFLTPNLIASKTKEKGLRLYSLNPSD